MTKVVVTFKLEEGVYSKLRGIAELEGRGVSGRDPIRHYVT